MPDENLFLNDLHQTSGRLAVFEDDGTSAWLYLCEADSRKPIADAWVFNRVVAPSTEKIRTFRGGPPPAARGYVSEQAQINDPLSNEWMFVWSTDGKSVAIAKDGLPMAFIIGGEKRGFSRELVKDGPWGHPWSEELFRSTFEA